MASEVYPVDLSFEVRLTKDMSAAELSRAVATLGELGLRAELDVYVPTFEEQLANHFEATEIKTTGDYLGKEHFMRFGETAGLKPSLTSSVAHCLMYPIYSDKKSRRIVRPADIGLIVYSREALGFPIYPAEKLKGKSQALRNKIEMHRGKFGDVTDETDRLINAGSLIEFCKRDDEELTNYLGKQGKEAFQVIVGAVKAQINSYWPRLL